MSFEIITDSCSNLLDETIDKFNIHILPMTFMIDGVQHQSYKKGEKSDLKQFYDMMREGKVFTTSLPSMTDREAHFREIAESGKDLLYIGFSSGLSGTYAAMAMLLDELSNEYPERKLLYTDTLAASAGQGLLVYKAAQMRENGDSIEEVRNWLEDNKLHLAHWFTVDDLMFLFRGGRVTKTSAWAGTMLNIKPVLHVDDEGHLIPMEKVMGRKKSIAGIIKHMQKTGIEPISEQTVFISHGDCIEDAEYLRDKVAEKFGVTDIHINYIDPVIGAHSGPGTLALFFLASER